MYFYVFYSLINISTRRILTFEFSDIFESINTWSTIDERAGKVVRIVNTSRGGGNNDRFAVHTFGGGAMGATNVADDLTDRPSSFHAGHNHKEEGNILLKITIGTYRIALYFGQTVEFHRRLIQHQQRAQTKNSAHYRLARKAGIMIMVPIILSPGGNIPDHFLDIAEFSMTFTRRGPAVTGTHALDIHEMAIELISLQSLERQHLELSADKSNTSRFELPGMLDQRFVELVETLNELHDIQDLNLSLAKLEATVTDTIRNVDAHPKHEIHIIGSDNGDTTELYAGRKLTLWLNDRHLAKCWTSLANRRGIVDICTWI
ncbi:hypothetical protein FSST1_006338 [Fusarium sambucinum]